jgi:predicted amino acid dehydrogenase
MFDTFWSILFWLGLWQISWWTYRILFFAYHSYFGERATTDRYGKDSWAVITGGSDGIGFACAKHLAKQGFNIVLLARNIEKLAKCADELKQINKEIKTRVIEIDFA